MRDEARRDGVAGSDFRLPQPRITNSASLCACGSGQAVDEILARSTLRQVFQRNTTPAPRFDIGTPDEPPAEESFLNAAAFAWLRDNAGGYGFAMSYPRGNPHGIVRARHWRFQRPDHRGMSSQAPRGTCFDPARNYDPPGFASG